MHDTRVLRQSQLWEVLGDGVLLGQNKVTISGCDVGHHLIGDPAYPLQEWLMKPFSDTGRLTQEQHNYNYRLSSARSVVEMCFGRLKGRWRCLLKINDSKLELSKTMALTCCFFTISVRNMVAILHWRSRIGLLTFSHTGKLYLSMAIWKGQT